MKSVFEQLPAGASVYKNSDGTYTALYFLYERKKFVEAAGKNPEESLIALHELIASETKVKIS